MTINTVSGPITREQLGVVAPHEHVLLDQSNKEISRQELGAENGKVKDYISGARTISQLVRELTKIFCQKYFSLSDISYVSLDQIQSNMEFNPKEFLGEVEEIDIGEQSTFATGFNHKDEGMLSILEKDAISKYQDLHQAAENSSTITEALVNAKLKGNMGIINVGGSTELAKQANYDLVEDAVKACESAYLFGVTPGQTIGIQTAIRELKFTDKYNQDEIAMMFLDAISAAYRDEMIERKRREIYKNVN